MSHHDTGSNTLVLTGAASSAIAHDFSSVLLFVTVSQAHTALQVLLELSVHVWIQVCVWVSDTYFRADTEASE